MILIVVSSLLDFHGSLAGDKRTTQVRGYQVLHFAALNIVSSSRLLPQKINWDARHKEGRYTVKPSIFSQIGCIILDLSRAQKSPTQAHFLVFKTLEKALPPLR